MSHVEEMPQLMGGDDCENSHESIAPVLYQPHRQLVPAHAANISISQSAAWQVHAPTWYSKGIYSRGLKL